MSDLTAVPSADQTDESDSAPMSSEEIVAKTTSLHAELSAKYPDCDVEVTIRPTYEGKVETTIRTHKRDQWRDNSREQDEANFRNVISAVIEGLKEYQRLAEKTAEKRREAEKK